MEYKFVCENGVCGHIETVEEEGTKYKTCPCCGDLMEAMVFEEE